MWWLKITLVVLWSIWFVKFGAVVSVNGQLVNNVVPESDAGVGVVSQSKPQQQQRNLQIDVEHNFLVGIAYTGWLHENNNTLCGKELELFLLAVINNDLWSLRGAVLDTFGLRPQSFEWGNYFWLGRQHLCDELNNPYVITFSTAHYQTSSSRFNVTSPFALQFAVVYMNFTTSHYIDLKLPFEPLIHLGLCLPKSCPTDRITRYTDLYFQSGIFRMQREYNIQLKAVDSRVPKFRWRVFLKTSSLLFLSTLLLLILLGIAAEIVYSYRTNLTKQKQLHTKALATAIEEKSTAEELLLCFRLSANFAKAFNVNSSGSASFLGVIAGLRTVICLWITTFHVYYYSIYAMRNAPMIFAKLEHFALQPIMQACFYVDVFFVISAFLLVSNFLSNESYMRQIRHNKFADNLRLYAQAILQRYLRLTPVLIIVMLMGDMAYELLNMYSPFYVGPHSGIYCKTNWWHNLLYIQNLFDMRDICCSWTWYLGCEMQYFILFTALLFVYAKNPPLAKIVYAAFALVFPVIGFFYNYRHGITFQIDVIHSTLNQLYVKPWVRINPYIGGMAFGWVLYRYRRFNQHQCPQQHKQQEPSQQHPVNMSQAQEQNDSGGLAAGRWRVAFWFCLALFYLATNFMSYFRSAPTLLIASIMSFGKLVFALFVGAAIVLCAWGHGGAFNRLLSSRLFLFLNKFSFSIYMVAPVIVVAVFGLRNEATTFSEVGSTLDFLGITALSIMSSFLIVVLLELPFQRISNAFIRRRL